MLTSLADGGLVKLHWQGDIRVLCGRIHEFFFLPVMCVGGLQILRNAAECSPVVVRGGGDRPSCRGPQDQLKSCRALEPGSRLLAKPTSSCQSPAKSMPAGTIKVCGS